MKFYYGEPPDVALEVASPTPLTTISPDQFNLFGGLIGVVVGALLMVLGGGFSAIFDAMDAYELWQVGAALISLVVVHEFIHLIGYGGLSLSSKVCFGFHPKLYMFYTFNPVAVSKRGFILAAGLPFVVLSVVPMVLVAIGTPYQMELVALAVANAVGAGGDIFLVATVYKTVPKNCNVQSSGMGEFWGTPVA